MAKRWKYAVLIAAVVGLAWVIVAFATGEREPEEPVYRGKKLSEWVMELPSVVTYSGKSEAEVAIRAMGSNAVPYLIEWVGYEPPQWRLKLYEVAGNFFSKAPTNLFQDRKMLRAAYATRAFGTVAPEGSEYKELGRMSQEVRRGLSKTYISCAMRWCENNERMVQFTGVQIAIGPGVMSSTVSAGRDRFTLVYGTNGAPLMAVSHPNPPAPASRQVKVQ